MAVISIGNLGCPYGGQDAPALFTRYALINPAKNINSVAISRDIPINPFEVAFPAVGG